MMNSLSLDDFFKSYLLSNKNDNQVKNVALKELFILNVETSQYFYRQIMILEVLLKYSLNATFETHFEGNWVTYFKNHPNELVRNYLEKELKSFPQESQIIAQEDFINLTSFGFWIGFFETKMYKNLKGVPILAFTNKPSEVNRKRLYKTLSEIKVLRNYIYHHKNTLSIETDLKSSIKSIENHDMTIKNLISWISPDILDIQFSENNLLDPISEVKKLI